MRQSWAKNIWRKYRAALNDAGISHWAGDLALAGLAILFVISIGFIATVPWGKPAAIGQYPWFDAYLLFLAVYPAAVFILVALSRRRESRQERLASALDDVVQRARSAQSAPRRVAPGVITASVADFAGVSRPVARAAVGGLTVTLDCLVIEKSRVHSRQFPFPAVGSDTEETLLTAIRNSCGVRTRTAAAILEAVRDRVSQELALAKGEVGTLEIFPLGLYEDLFAEFPMFSPQSFLLKNHYFELGHLLIEFRRESAGR